jgi:hypothetical protein
MVIICFDCPGSADINQGTMPSLATALSTTTFMPNDKGGAVADGFCDLSTQAIYSNSGGDDAPILRFITSVPYNQDWVLQTGAILQAGTESLDGIS